MTHDLPDPRALDRPVRFDPVVEPLRLGARLWAALSDWRGLIILGAAIAVVVMV